jgi:hypothetical protein
LVTLSGNWLLLFPYQFRGLDYATAADLSTGDLVCEMKISKTSILIAALTAILTAGLYADTPAEPAKPGSPGDKPTPEQPGTPPRPPGDEKGTPQPGAPAKPGSSGDKPATPPPNVPKGNGGN